MLATEIYVVLSLIISLQLADIFAAIALFLGGNSVAFVTSTTYIVLRVLHIIESLAPAGAEQVLVNTLPALRRLGVDCEVAVLWKPYDLSQELRSQCFRVHELDVPSTWGVIPALRALRQVLSNGRFDVAHAHLPMAVFYAAMAHGNVPLVATFHGLSFEHYPANTPAKKLRRNLERWWTNHRVDAYIAVSESVADHYHEILSVSREEIEIIPNGFPELSCPCSEEDRKLVRRRFAVPHRVPLLLNAGRFVKQKGHVHLLSAARILRDRGIDFCLLVVGQGPLQEEIEGLLESWNLRDRVKISAPMPHRELMKAFCSADIFVLPSISEGFGMAAGEAMALGVPVVASNLRGVASLIQNGISGTLVPPGDATALADALAALLQDPGGGQRMAVTAAGRIRSNFSIDVIAGRIADVYQKLIRSE